MWSTYICSSRQKLEIYQQVSRGCGHCKGTTVSSVHTKVVRSLHSWSLTSSPMNVVTGEGVTSKHLPGLVSAKTSYSGTSQVVTLLLLLAFFAPLLSSGVQGSQLAWKTSKKWKKHQSCPHHQPLLGSAINPSLGRSFIFVLRLTCILCNQTYETGNLMLSHDVFII